MNIIMLCGYYTANCFNNFVVQSVISLPQLKLDVARTHLHILLPSVTHTHTHTHTHTCQMRLHYGMAWSYQCQRVKHSFCCVNSYLNFASFFLGPVHILRAKHLSHKLEQPTHPF